MKSNEHQIQSGIVANARLLWPELETLLFAIPNGGKRDARTGAVMKREGVTAGVLDLFLAIPRNGFHGLWIEVKDPKYRNRKNGGMSGKQLEWSADVRNQGYCVALVYSVEEAIAEIKGYLR